jgi:hypothetical protein
MIDQSLRDRISDAVTEALRPLPAVFAGWEGGSAAFGAVDTYSDIDLEYVVADDASFEDLYALAERAIEAVSPITASHTPLKGRYYKLKDGGDFFLVDLIFHRAGDPDHRPDIVRHGERVPLFDKGNWLRPNPLDTGALAAQRVRRYRDFRYGFP